MKYVRILFYILLAIPVIIFIMIVWPKGSIADQLASRNVPALGYGIIMNGEVTESDVIGELEAGIEAPDNAIFNVASVTKPIFSLVVLKLIDAEVIDLDEPIHPYWTDPEIADDPRHELLTPRILLSHQAGFPNWRWNSPEGTLAFQFDPGTRYQYSGEGMEYLRKVIEAKTGLSLAKLADSLVFDPIGMTDSRLIWDEEMDESRLAKWHNKEGGQYELFKRQEANAADDLMTTVQDLELFSLYVMEGAGLSEELFREMVSPQVKVNEQWSYGLGWQLVPQLDNGEYALVHGGSDEGVRARITILPESRRAFIGMANGDLGQQVIDRVMVDNFEPGADLLGHIYSPYIWRVIHMPMNVPL